MSAKTKDFVVIKFRTKHEDGDEDVDYMCLLKGWIKSEQNRNVIVCYPDEEESQIEKRVKKREPMDKNWPEHNGRILYQTTQYARGLNYVKALRRYYVIPKKLEQEYQRNKILQEESNRNKESSVSQSQPESTPEQTTEVSHSEKRQLRSSKRLKKDKK